MTKSKQFKLQSFFDITNLWFWGNPSIYVFLITFYIKMGSNPILEIKIVPKGKVIDPN